MQIETEAESSMTSLHVQRTISSYILYSFFFKITNSIMITANEHVVTNRLKL